MKATAWEAAIRLLHRLQLDFKMGGEDMKIKNYTYSRFIICLILFFVLLQGKVVLAQENNLLVISNTKGVPDEMNMQDLKSILKGERQRWGDGTKVVIALMKTNTPAGQTTLKKIYGMTADELNKYWLALVFQGKAKAPAFFNSVTELQAFVEQTPGAIGIIEPVPYGNFKKVTIDGKKTF
jgi:hypothetical protein